MIVHTHPLEKCTAGKPAESRQMVTRVPQASAEAGVKTLGIYGAPQEDTVFAIVEVDDFALWRRAMIPMIALGTARIIPCSPRKSWCPSGHSLDRCGLLYGSRNCFPVGTRLP